MQNLNAQQSKRLATAIETLAAVVSNIAQENNSDVLSLLDYINLEDEVKDELYALGAINYSQAEGE